MADTVIIKDSAGTPNTETLNCIRVDHKYINLLTHNNSPAASGEGATHILQSNKVMRNWILTFHLTPANYISTRNKILVTMPDNGPVKLNMSNMSSMGWPHVLPLNWTANMDYSHGGDNLIEVKLTVAQCSAI